MLGFIIIGSFMCSDSRFNSDSVCVGKFVLLFNSYTTFGHKKALMYPMNIEEALIGAWKRSSFSLEVTLHLHGGHQCTNTESDSSYINPSTTGRCG